MKKMIIILLLLLSLYSFGDVFITVGSGYFKSYYDNYNLFGYLANIDIFFDICNNIGFSVSSALSLDFMHNGIIDVGGTYFFLGAIGDTSSFDILVGPNIFFNIFEFMDLSVSMGLHLNEFSNADYHSKARVDEININRGPLIGVGGSIKLLFNLFTPFFYVGIEANGGIDFYDCKMNYLKFIQYYFYNTNILIGFRFS